MDVVVFTLLKLLIGILFASQITNAVDNRCGVFPQILVPRLETETPLRRSIQFGERLLAERPDLTRTARTLSNGNESMASRAVQQALQDAWDRREKINLNGLRLWLFENLTAQIAAYSQGRNTTFLRNQVTANEMSWEQHLERLQARNVLGPNAFLRNPRVIASEPEVSFTVSDENQNLSHAEAMALVKHPLTLKFLVEKLSELEFNLLSDFLEGLSNLDILVRRGLTLDMVRVHRYNALRNTESALNLKKYILNTPRRNSLEQSRAAGNPEQVPASRVISPPQVSEPQRTTLPNRERARARRTVAQPETQERTRPGFEDKIQEVATNLGLTPQNINDLRETRNWDSLTTLVPLKPSLAPYQIHAIEDFFMGKPISQIQYDRNVSQQVAKVRRTTTFQQLARSFRLPPAAFEGIENF